MEDMRNVGLGRGNIEVLFQTSKVSEALTSWRSVGGVAGMRGEKDRRIFGGTKESVEVQIH